MKILVIAANYAYSFINQAQSLAKGLSQLDHKTEVLKTSRPEEVKELMSQQKFDVVFGVGNWPDYDLLVKTPSQFCESVLPWITADNPEVNQFVKEYNQLKIILTPSLHCKDNLVLSGIKENLIKVIPEAVDPDLWYQMDEKEITNFLNYLSVPNPDSFASKFDLIKLHQEKTPIIFTTGGDATKKGAQEVIKALSALEKTIPWIYLIKTWPYPMVLEKSTEELKLAQQLGIFDRVRYLVGEFSQTFMRGLMSLCDIYAAPSRVEGFGLPHVEAQMCGKPVVSIDAVAVRETILHQETGFLAKPIVEEGLTKADVPELTKYFHLLLTDPMVRKQMGAKAKTHALNNFQPKVIANKFLKELVSF